MLKQTARTEKERLCIVPLAAECADIGRALWRLEAARARLLATLDGVDAAILDWQPDPGANTIGTLLYHIAAIEADWLFVEVLEAPFDSQTETLLRRPVRDANGRLTHVPGVPLNEHISRLHTVRQTLLDAFAAMSLADFRRARLLEPYDVTPEWVLFHLTQHETEHRGQIQEMIRLWNNSESG